MKLIILDRDGVINRDSDSYIKSPDEWHPLPGSLEAIARLHSAGYRIVVATNQSGIARGLFDLATLGAIHSKMHHAVTQVGGHIDAVFFCPHSADSQCDCRKPKPGLFYEILRRYHLPANEVIAVGDSLRDLQAASAAAIRSYLVLTGNGQKTRTMDGVPTETTIHDSLGSLVDHLLS